VGCDEAIEHPISAFYNISSAAWVSRIAIELAG